MGDQGLSGAGRLGGSEHDHVEGPPSFPADRESQSPNARRWRPAGRFTAALGVLTALLTWGCAALIYAHAREFDHRLAADQRQRVVQAIVDLRARLAVSPGRNDAEFVAADAWPGRWQRTFETDAAGRLAGEALAQLSPSTRQLIGELSGRYDEERPAAPESEAVVVSDFVLEGDAVSLAVARREAAGASRDRAGRLTLSAVPLDHLLPGIERRSGVTGLTVVAQPANDRPEVLTLADRRGRITGWLTWQAGPGLVRDAVRWAAVLVVLGGVFLALTLAWMRQLRRLKTAIARDASGDCDVMTGLPNRQALIEGLDRALAERSDAAAVAFVHIDTKGFKDINQTLGHEAGDQLLAALAARLREELPPGGLLGRLGADEFALVVSGPDPDLGLAMARAIEGSLARPFSFGGHRRHLAASIGFSQAPRDGLRRDELVLRADMALRAAKKLGRSSIVAFEPGIEAELQEQTFLKHELRRALDDGALHLHYQPIVASDGARLCGVEALLRWTHPTRGAIPPNVFVPVAEQTGLMDELGAFVLRRALADAQRWANLYIAVNISPVQMRDPGFIALVAGVIRETGIAPQRVVLEVTEGVLIDNPDEAQKRLEALRALGIRIALDDFGIGYSSLSYLQRFPFDKLKIDKEFVAPLGRSASGAVIVQSIVGLGRALGLTVLAEGVETEEQRVLLRLAGCNQMQGFLFARPTPRATIDELVARAEARAAGARRARG